MKPYIPIPAMFVLAISACQPLPTMTRSGNVTDIVIMDDTPSTAAYVQVGVGDELRWTNKRMASVRITFLERISDQMSCRNNFEGYFTGGADVILKPDQSASLCFGDLGTIPYIMRMDPLSPDEEDSRSGQVHIAASASPSTQDASATKTTGIGRTPDANAESCDR